MFKVFLAFFIAILVSTNFFTISHAALSQSPLTKENQQLLTPELVLQRLILGNMRFRQGELKNRDLLKEAKQSSIKGQFPAAIILSCMDSRGSPELIFNQGLGDLFSIRVAGNIIDPDQLGSMEYAVQVVGTKLLVVMGHTQCGAVQGACKQVTLGHLTQLLDKIKPAVQTIKKQSKLKLDCENQKMVDAIARQNVLNMMHATLEQSAIIREKVANHQIMVVGALHYLRTGEVLFFDEQDNIIH